MGIKQNVFGLEQIYRLQVEGNWSTREDVWNVPSPFNIPSPAPFGYLGGGYEPSSSNISIVDRIDYSNDTASSLIKGPLTAVRRGAAGVSNGSFGYYGGGTPGNTNLERIDYSNDTATALSRGPLSHNDFNNNAGTSNLSYGYFAGGGSPITTEVDRVDFSNDTATALAKGPLTVIRQEFSGTGNLSFGYFAGGETPGLVSSVDRLDYGNDTATASPKGPLSALKKFAMGSGNDGFGYFSGGQTPSHVSTVDRVDYSNDTAAAAVKGPLSSPATLGSATGNSSFGYVFGYNNGRSQRINYSNDTATALAKGQIYSVGDYRYWTGATSRKENGHPDTSNISPVADNFGYFGGGEPNTSTVDRIDYSNDTATASVKGSLTVVRRELAATSSTSFGYFGGGGNPSISIYISTVDRIDYSNDTADTVAKGPLSVGRRLLAATGNASFGYFGGGLNPTLSPSRLSSVDRVEYANDTATASPKGPLSAGRYSLASTGNQNFGYFAAGYPGGAGYVSTVDRVDYSNDTATAVAKGPLSITRYGVSATGNADFGYFAGADPANSIVDRIDYSNDTATASPKGPLSAANKNMGATGNASFGYFAGGGSPHISKVDRIDYSNDTATASPKGPLSEARYGFGGASAGENALPTDNGIINNLLHTAEEPRDNVVPQGTDFGYFGGGTPQGSTMLSTVERIDYSNDTTVETKGPLSAARRYFGATGNASFGYFIGGKSTSPFSTVDRIDYSNDTPTAVAKGPLASVRSNFGATGNADFGYVGGGKTPSSVSSVERIDYSSDTSTASPKGPLSAGRYNVIATGNQNFGYFGGGSHPVVSTVDRVDYSNDTATAVAKGPLSSARRYHGATGNADFGYFGGGFSPSASATVSTVSRIDYSNDTATAVAKGPLGTAIERMGATGNTSFGYFAGGQPSHSSANRVDYSNDTATALAKGPLSAAKQSLTAASSRANATPLKGPGVLEVPVLFGPLSVTSPIPIGTDFGYYLGGANGSKESTAERIDYTNDTATAVLKGPLTSARRYAGGAGNASFGYSGGGQEDVIGIISKVDRVDYSNDTATASPKGNLNTAVEQLAGTGNVNFGYFGGGSAPSESTLVQRVNYAADTATALLKGPLTQITREPASFGNQDFGYFAGGTPNQYTTVNRIDYSNDTPTASARGPLASGTYAVSATSNTSFGYIAGGRTAPGASAKTLVQRVDFSNDTATSSPKGPLSSPSARAGATGNSAFGYFAGKFPGSSLIDRIDYSNDTATATPKGNLTNQIYAMAGVSSRDNGIPTTQVGTINYAAGTLATHNKGYFFGGWPDNSYIRRLDYSNDDFATISTNLLEPGHGGAGLSSRIHAYHVAGNAPGSPAIQSMVQRINYFNDTITQVHPTSAPGNGRATGTFNDDYGWYAFDNATTFRRLDFSNDIESATPKGNFLTLGNSGQASVGNSSYGYFHRGGPGVHTTIQRIDYSNDTAAAVAKGPLPVAIQQTGGTGTSDYGYIAGGETPANSISNIYRIDYSNDTADAPSRNNLYQAMDRMTATGNSSSGYFSGFPSNAFSKLDFSNDTAAVTTNVSTAGFGYIWWIGSASAKEYGLNTSANPSVVENTVTPVYPYTVFGYFRTNSSNVNRVNFANDIEGGVHLSNTLSPGTQSKSMAYSSSTHAYFSRQDTERIDYSNDTATFVTVGGMPTTRQEGAAVQSLTHGYVLGGFASSVYRLDFANDTATMSTRGNLADTRREFGAAGNLTHAYIMGDGNAQKIDYSNDTATATYLSPTISGSGNTYATGSLTHGYLATSDYIQKFDYSNDTASPSSYNQFSTSLGSNGGASGNADFGYFVGRSNKDLHRLNFANDTQTPKTRGSLANNSEQYGAGTSTREFGLRG